MHHPSVSPDLTAILQLSELQPWVSTVHHYPLPAHWRPYLPDVVGPAGWSIVDGLLQELPIWSLPALQRSVSRRLAAHLQASPAGPEPPLYNDVAGMVNGYLDAIQGACNAADYVLRLPAPSQHTARFNLDAWWEYHIHHCAQCRGLGPLDAVRHSLDTSVSCYIKHILVWLGGGWVPPFASWPHPVTMTNYPSIAWAAQAVDAECTEMLASQVLVPEDPVDPAVIIHPLSVVVKLSDLRDRTIKLTALSAPPPCAMTPENVDLINQHVQRVMDLDPARAREVKLKPIKARVCTDMSATKLNEHTRAWKFSYCSVLDATRKIKPGSWLCKIDLKRQFHQLPFLRAYRKYFGIHYQGLRLVFARAQFGYTLFPALSNTIMAEVSAILTAHGIPNCILTDDILLIADSEAECRSFMATALQILEELGWLPNLDKLEGPSQHLEFLGILIDTVQQRLSIDASKLESIIMALDSLLAEPRAVLARDLESMIGRLGWVASVMISGRPYLQFLWPCLPAHRRHGQRVRLTDLARRDLRWWRRRLQQAIDDPDHTSIWAPFWNDPPSRLRIFTDASGHLGFGAVLSRSAAYEVLQGRWHRPLTGHRTSAWAELVPILFALQRVGSQMAGQVLIITTDSSSNVFALNKGSTQEYHAAKLLRRIFELAEQHRLYLIGDWIRRLYNDVCDALSKFSVPNTI